MRAIIERKMGDGPWEPWGTTRTLQLWEAMELVRMRCTCGECQGAQFRVKLKGDFEDEYSWN
jgi:hypothetical protein